MANKDVLIRNVSLDVRERVRRIRWRQRIKLREVLEKGLMVLEAAEGKGDQYQDQAAEKARAAMARIAQIKEEVRAYEEAIKLKKSIEKMQKNPHEMGERKTQMNLFLNLKKADEDLSKIIGEFIPKHEIPDDLEERRKMGLPDEYCQKEKCAITRDFDRNLDQMPEKKSDETDAIFADSSLAEEMKRKLEEFKRQTGKNKEEQEPDQKFDTTGLENGVDEEPVKKENDSKFKMRYVGSSENSRSSEEKKKEIKTTVFSRGFEGYGDD